MDVKSKLADLKKMKDEKEKLTAKIAALKVQKDDEKKLEELAISNKPIILKKEEPREEIKKSELPKIALVKEVEEEIESEEEESEEDIDNLNSDSDNDVIPVKKVTVYYKKKNSKPKKQTKRKE